ncbi:alpha/beta-hydrolase [Microthyrium microscopicum]|uniref:Alpha/beta-hydrolase n=1 Tax=Microthyrium microscopicum TaxID=703497 RepID=A0A6A6UKZ5_9PEZI|nr:alpha/beta-hydrolase [Microthyrium microscopicum]
MKLPLLYLLCSIKSAVGSPLSTSTAISSADFNSLLQGANFAAAAYCDSNTKAGSKSVTCTGTGSDICPQASGATILGTFSNSGAVGYVARSGNNIVVAFQGSKSGKQFLDDFNVFQTPVDFWCSGCQVMGAFLNDWEVVSTGIIATIKQALVGHANSPILVLGHSLGAGVATFAAVDIQGNFTSSPVTLLSYASPRLGNQAWADWYTANGPKISKIYRVTHHKDEVPQIPHKSSYNSVWRHFGPEYYITKEDLSPAQSDIVMLAEQESDLGIDGKPGNITNHLNDPTEHRNYMIHLSGNTGC